VQVVFKRTKSADGNEQTMDWPTSASNPLCQTEEEDEGKIAALGFPVLSILAESPAVLNCVRYVLEVAWSDILKEFVPEDTNLNDDSITMLHADSAAYISTWKTRCEVKLKKLKTCHAQAAFSYKYSKTVEDSMFAEKKTLCPFILDAELSSVATIMYTVCLVSINNYQQSISNSGSFSNSAKNKHYLFDPFLSYAWSTSRANAHTTTASDSNSVYMLKLADFGCILPLDPAKCNKWDSHVFHAMHLLALINNSDTGVADMPDLSRNFVTSLIAEEKQTASAQNDELRGASLSSSSSTSFVRQSGLMGTKRGYDFLFPNGAGRSVLDGGQVVDNRASSQCYEAMPYWPRNWQAPFGEIIHETLEEMTGYSNYMALLTPDEDCATAGTSCVDTVVVLPDHLRIENMTTAFFGTGGLCREHSFGMPLVPTNTIVMCTSSLRSSVASGTDAADTVEDLACEDSNSPSCSCSETPQIGMLGGVGETLGHLWPLYRMFLQENPAESSGSFGLAFNQTFFDTGTQYIARKLMQHVGLEDLSIYVRPPADQESVSDIVRKQCYHSSQYGVDAPEHGINKTMQNCRQSSSSNSERVERVVCCNYNEHCNQRQGQICNALGICESMDIDVENVLSSPEQDIEVGVTCAACNRTDQNQFSGASPWRRMRDIMEQHGMCSHLNRITYERMHALLQEKSADLGCFTDSFLDNDANEKKYWVCPRNAINWTWVRERPGFASGMDSDAADSDMMLDTRALPETPSVLEEGLFDLQPHLCDAEYMHSQTLSWCKLQHRARVPASVAQEEESSYNSWMRNAPLHSQFSTLFPPDPDLRADKNAPKDKLRFMGMHSAMMQQKDASVAQNIAIQQCGALGVCQTESFTFGGVHVAVRKKAKQVVASPQSQSATTISTQFTSTTGKDMMDCGAMGYEDTLHLNSCILDASVAPIMYVLKYPNTYDTNMACQQIFTSNLMSLEVDATREELRYPVGRAFVKKRVNMLNRYLNMDSSVVRSSFFKTADDKRVAMTALVMCSENVHAFAAANAQRTQTKYNRHHVPGLYVFLEWGTYEVPIFWWLKLGISKCVFEVEDGRRITDLDLQNYLPVPLQAFDERIGIASSVQNANTQLVVAEGTSLQEFWSRINANELSLFIDTRRVLASTLSTYARERIQISMVGGCAREYSVNDTLLQEMRTCYNADGDGQNKKRNRYKIESMLVRVFGPKNAVNGYPSAELWADKGQSVLVQQLTALTQFQSAKLLDSTEGLSSLLKFQSSTLDVFDSGNPDDALSMGFLHYIFSSLLTNMLALDQFNPLYNPTLAVVQDSAGNGIKILDFDVSMFVAELVKTDVDAVKIYMQEYLALFDADFEEDNVGKTAIPDASLPPAVAFQRNVDTQNPQDCIYDMNDVTSLEKQSADTYQSDGGPFVKFCFDAAIPSTCNTREMCSPTAPADVERFGNTNPSPPGGVPQGGRCSLADLDVNNYNVHTDFTRDPYRTENFARQNSQAPSMKTCYERQDHAPPELSREPVIDQADGEPVYAGLQYVQKDAADELAKKRGNKLCHRIDSGCVTYFDRKMQSKLFGTSQDTTGSSPVNLRYAALERNAYNQVNGRMWQTMSNVDKNRFKNNRWGPNDMYEQNVETMRFMQIMDDWKTVEDQTKMLYSTTGTQSPGNTCALNSMSWSSGLTVEPFVLNKLLPEASFSHVIYNDRILMRRMYSDSTEQQLFGHHFDGQSASRENGRQHTSPTPLFSHCPSDWKEQAKAYGNMHRFKRVNFQQGTLRMYERFHKFNQRIFLKPDMTAWIGDYAEITEGNADTSYCSFGDDVCKDTHAWWSKSSFYNDNKDAYSGRAFRLLFFFKSKFRWITTENFNNKDSQSRYDGSGTMTYDPRSSMQNTLTKGPLRFKVGRDAYLAKYEEKLQSRNKILAALLPAFPCDDIPTGICMPCKCGS